MVKLKMKKVLTILMCLALALGSLAFAEEQDLFAVLNGYEWSFLSGVGGWSTDMRIRADGSFTGEFHDSEMGEAGEGYPDGSLYFCSFSGRMSVVGQLGENSWKIRVDRLENEPAQESIEDGIRYVPADIYGLSEGDEMILYAPGTPVSILSEEMQLWAHVIDQETPPTELESWFLMSEKNDSGFVSYPLSVGLANPWEDLTAGELEAASGLAFGVPDDAERVIYRFLRSENLAEMQFMIGSDIFNARIQPMVLEEGQLRDVSWMISGLAYDWMNEEAVSIGQCSGIFQQAQDGDSWIEVCLWYDARQQLMYSLSVCSSELDGLDLTAIAEQIYNK